MLSLHMSYDQIIIVRIAKQPHENYLIHDNVTFNLTVTFNCNIASALVMFNFAVDNPL